MGAELAGRTAVVTGASKGIGLAVVNALAASGAHVVAGARRTSPELAELAKAGQVEAVEVDLASPAGPARLVAAAGERVDILVNNVGGAPARPGGFLSITDEDWLATLNLDLMAAVRATRSALPSMLAAKAGVDRQRLLGERPAARPGRAGLQRGQGRRWPRSARRWPRRSDRRASGSTRSAPGPSRPTCGSVPGESPRRWVPPPVRGRTTWPARPPASWSRAGSPSRPSGPPWCCSWPATARPTSPEPTSPSTAGWFRPGSQGRAGQEDGR